MVVLLTSEMTAEKNTQHLVTHGWLGQCLLERIFFQPLKMFVCVRIKF